MVLGHKLYGSGSDHVVVIHDWFCDSTSYDPILPYLNLEQFTYLFVDLRGYGASKKISGKYTVDEATTDILELVQSLSWEQFHVVGHSMGAMIAQKIASTATLGQVSSLVAITPVPACGSPAPDDVIEMLEDAATDNDAAGRDIVHFLTDQRHSTTFAHHKVMQWRNTSTSEARLGYLKMFTGTDFSSDMEGLSVPCLVIVGANDSESHSEPIMRETLLYWLPDAQLEVLQNSGHYPMQEMPVVLAGQIEIFLTKHSVVPAVR